MKLSYVEQKILMYNPTRCNVVNFCIYGHIIVRGVHLLIIYLVVFTCVYNLYLTAHPFQVVLVW